MYDFADFLKHSVGEASKLALNYFGAVTSTVKQDDNNQVLTEADLVIGKYLVKMSREAFPGFNIIDEEAGVIDNDSQYTIVIDPIDGTSNFANSLPHFGIFLGVLHAGVPVAGAIALPAFGDIYIAEKGKGAYRNDQPVRVSQTDKLKNTLVAYGIDGHQENPSITHEEILLLGDVVLAVRNIRSTNSAFDIAAVADGRYGLVLNRTTKVWDNVAAHIVIEEAGGVYTDFYGRPMNYDHTLESPERNYTVCAGAPLLHAEMQRVIHAKDA